MSTLAERLECGTVQTRRVADERLGAGGLGRTGRHDSARPRETYAGAAAGAATNRGNVGAIYEDGEGLTLKLELAGVEPRDVNIRFENGVLTVKGERKLEKEEKKEKKENYHRVELSYGAFNRSFSLPPTVDADRIEASSKSGVLVVHLPKKAEAKPKSIQVKVN
jgi:HSP20 family molecular chaperone IbpA